MHANARLTPHGRTLLVQRVRLHARPVAHVAAELGISRQCAHRWVRRYDPEPSTAPIPFPAPRPARDEVTRLFAAALHGDRGAEHALLRLGAVDDRAAQASISLLH